MVRSAKEDSGAAIMRSEQVWFHPEAIEDANAAYEWYFEQDPNVAAAYILELDQAFERIQEAPHRYAPYVQGTRRYVMPRFPFYVVFRVGVHPGSIQVLAVVHARRRPWYWQHRR